MRAYKKIFANAWKWWQDDQVPRLAAAFTFYAMLSLAPMLLMAVATAGFVLGDEGARQTLLQEFRRSMGEAQAAFIASLFKNQSTGTGIIATIFSLAVLVYGASALFEQLRDSVNAIWGVKPPDEGILGIVRRKLFAILSVAAVAVALLGWMILDARIQWLSANSVFEVPAIWKLVSFISAWGFSALLFAAIFKMMPRQPVKWSDVWSSAIFTALMFSLGKYLLSQYFALALVSAAYGAAGSLVVILLWIYYSSQIIFFGVELSNAYTYELGSRKGQPHDSEVAVTQTGKVSETPPAEGSAKDADAQRTVRSTERLDGSYPTFAPSLTTSMADLSASLSSLGRSLSDLGKSMTGKGGR